MKLKYIANTATASVFTVGGAFASTPQGNISTIADNLTGSNPSAEK